MLVRLFAVAVGGAESLTGQDKTEREGDDRERLPVALPAWPRALAGVEMQLQERLPGGLRLVPASRQEGSWSATIARGRGFFAFRNRQECLCHIPPAPETDRNVWIGQTDRNVCIT